MCEADGETIAHTKTIKVDSVTQVSFRILTSSWCNSKTNWNCKVALNRLRNRISLVMVPSYIGHEGNEKVYGGALLGTL